MPKLSMEEREILSQMHAAQHPQEAIAARLGRCKSTISRELRRNGQAGGGYSAVAAQRKAVARRSERPLVRKLDRPELRQAVVSRLTREWSPDQISARLKYENLYRRTNGTPRRLTTAKSSATMRRCHAA